MPKGKWQSVGEGKKQISIKSETGKNHAKNRFKTNKVIKQEMPIGEIHFHDESVNSCL
jgi:hypothetical protein